jgi:hypothetical protein
MRQEAGYWIDTSEGFVESLLTTVTAPDTFYLCLDHGIRNEQKVVGPSAQVLSFLD